VEGNGMSTYKRILGRIVSFYHHSYKGDRGYEKGWHGRVAIGIDADPEGERQAKTAIDVEYHAPCRSYGVSFKASHDEDPLKASFTCGLFGLYFGVERMPMLSKIRDAIVRAWPLAEQMSKFSGREFSLRFFDHAVWWSIGSDDMGWSSKTPRWRHGSWHPLGFYMRQGEPELLETRPVVVPMQERSYQGTAKLERTRWGFTRLPRLFDRTDYHVDITMAPGEQVPFPGKGENAYDCGEDASFGMSMPARTIEDGIGRFVGSVLHSRVRHGGTKWTPEAEARS
jgi:hypothetical protein